MVFLYKLLYINILSFLLHLFFVIWEDGKMGKWEFLKNVTLCVAVVYLRESVGDGVEVGRSWIIYPPDRF